ncbi:MAG: hypothetical protein KF708_21735 [Pirellulales bacterium]|nr:hypothetical protein [Pirellulales bacterium]
MAKRAKKQAEQEHFGTDSFLDVVANMVGIVIILVMVVAMRVRHPRDDQVEVPDVDLETPAAVAAQLEGDVLRLAAETEQLTATMAMRFAERSRLALLESAREQALAEAKAKLDSQAQADLALNRELAGLQANVDQLERQLDQVDAQAIKQTKTIESYPTPISKTVHGQELHVQLRGGRITHIPVDRLVAEVKADFQSKAGRLANSDSYVGTVGPRGGFAMRYTIERVGSTGQATLVGVTQWQLIPNAPRMGETLDEALAGQSEFRLGLAGFGPRDTTITLWVYPDSFAAYRTLKKELYRAGYATAGRPLPDGVLIGASPMGTKSAAQ